MGRTEFEDWSNRIIAGALVPADVSAQKFALANMIMHLGPTESHKPDAHFIHTLRKTAVNQVADQLRREYHDACKKKLEEQEAASRLAGDHPDNVTPIGGASPA